MDAPIQLPPLPAKTMDYPGAIGLSIGVALTVLLLYAAGKFDFSHGPLTISLLILLMFGGVMIVSMLYNVPQDETTGAVVGALVLAVGGVITYWLSPKSKDGE